MWAPFRAGVESRAAGTGLYADDQEHGGIDRSLRKKDGDDSQLLLILMLTSKSSFCQVACVYVCTYVCVRAQIGRASCRERV